MKTESSPSSRKGIPSKMKGQKMPPRAQIIRLARIASLLKTNSCPSAEKIIEEYREIELEEGKNIKGKYSKRTVFRDIAVLRDEYGCPIKYNWGEKRYELLDPKWEFNCPAYLTESALFALVIGSHVAEEIFPNPMRARIKNSVDELLKGNDTAFFEKTILSSLKIFADGGEPENSGVFTSVFEAWRTHRRLKIWYDDQHGGISERIVDPHVLFHHLREWRIKAYCHLKNAPRTFVINRIKNAYPLKETFKPDKKIINSVTQDNLSSFSKLRDVKIKLMGDAVKFAKANRMHSKQKIKNGLFAIPEVSPEVILPWILAQGGEAVPLEPPELIEAFRKKVQALSGSLPPKQ